MFLVNSRLGLFSATSLSFYVSYILQAVPLLPKLRGHFAEFLNNSSSARLRILSSPTCVGLRYGRLFRSIEAFLGSLDSRTSLLVFFRSLSHLDVLKARDLPLASVYMLSRTLPVVRFLYPSASLLLSIALSRYGIFYPLSIAYAFRPLLRSRLTLSGRAFLRNP
jgi:hypothetical protein